MDNAEIFVGLDIGTTAIKVIVAESNNGEMNVIGAGTQLSRGLSRGVIVDIDQAAGAIHAAIEQAEQKANVHIDSVILGIPANQLKIEPASGMVAVSEGNQTREITDRDVQNVTNAALLQSLPPEREIISITADEFVVDGFDDIQDPRGMMGVRLEMHGTMYTGPKTIVHNAKKAVEQAGLHVADVTVTPVALGQTVLNDGEQDFGTVIIDLGGGQTTAAVIHDHKLKYTTVDQEGGNYITKDISVVLNTSLADAEKIKRDYGFANTEDASEKNQFPVTVVGQNKPVQVSEEYLAEIIEARLQQIFETIRASLDEVSALELPGGVVLTGGVAALPGIVELAEDILGVNVRIYVPEQMGLRHPQNATALSLITYSGRQSETRRLVKDALMGEFVAQTSQAPVADGRTQRQQVANEASQQPSAKPKAPKEKKSRTNRVGDFIRNFFD
ncbi:MAG: cell division protein FtsA [Furfurilactobacillus sp.]|jgi:cell division protein FtsA|uniref:cell division protein FtsA n=1 Tax=Furfurilactobacillus sp. TaxID=2767911 RepID=UPI002583BEF4|nr:cell division protein FtsA [Furfurilactobacillus sp.]MCH4011041.1 cell division protein FtsA [Furfurilactobacillus sp.]MCH4036933.1 cell division protein FtsA [Furfurilactobacillus sp.]MCH4114121.1 cell division protein FtsA [Furfurilactobacillus sp.]MCH4133056.1 cell division protein FtsA [Furfurilactobacillus sp.]MCI1340933.1 cell division protein FtsA [Furfurilactobacillus sp.]